MTDLLPYLPAIMVGIGLILGLIVSRLIYGYHRDQKILNSIRHLDPCSPGFTHYRRLKRLNADMAYYCAAMAGIPSVILAAQLLNQRLGGFTITTVNLFLIGGLTMALSIAVMLKVIVGLCQRRRLSLAYEAEVVVGQELDRLASTGYRVFHDVAAEPSPINHIVVGSKGVFVVQTVARPKPKSNGKNQPVIPVEYNGHVLFYPDGKDLETLKQAGHQASWLSDWLSRQIGQPIATRSIVALPGWTVKRTSASGIPVVNPNQFPSLFEHIQPRHLSEDMIAGIVEQVARRCRSEHLSGEIQPVSKNSGIQSMPDRRPDRQGQDVPSDVTL